MDQKEANMSTGEKREEKRKERLQLEFTPEAMQRLDEIKEISGSATRAETIRNALRLYGWFIKETKSDSIIRIIDDKEVTTSFRASLLHDLAGKK